MLEPKVVGGRTVSYDQASNIIIAQKYALELQRMILRLSIEKHPSIRC